jgi:cell division septation protein DedD
MGDIFDEKEFRPAEYRPDTELTLGPVVLVSLLFGLLLLCGVCFWQGYSIGSRASKGAPPAAQQPGAQASASAASSLHKPLAAPPATAPPRAAAAGVSPSGASVAGVNSAQPAVKPALPATAIAPTPAPASAQPAPAFGVAPAGVWMVQIATVSHQEDADVLVGALRRRGYAVTVRRDPADKMFHVQVGPFPSPGDANAARQKLLNDGYNAVVQP